MIRLQRLSIILIVETEAQAERLMGLGYTKIEDAPNVNDLKEPEEPKKKAAKKKVE